ncbi:ABC-type antimicrobial peptide transport system permease subunit [Saccharopolyspora lacisalsi]|uniref:ABC-type antimicrobial peptide transport system permease subunit n=1 Tax=Halosaccharopolyspora lacisalsi TaxID=1000566 RepID=A0A839DU90_9PSEU|nr:ABC transporter permease [Halosaccharopolyspora lacisalsi]MBA8824613.1 ABC-type antimicrobial peptide transport system permease subunit [Halosaccharopolyspora lacisalsi]
MTRRSSARARLGDLALGIRLAVGGDRTPWGRLLLTAVGIGLGVGVLLLAASVPTMKQARDERQNARQEIAGVLSHYPHSSRYQDSHDPSMLVTRASTEFRDQRIQGRALEPLSPDAPVPPGLQRIPGPGQMVVSPALRELLRGSGGELLKPRLPDHVVGVIDKEGLISPNELFYYTGTTNLSEGGTTVAAVYPGDSPSTNTRSLSGQMWIILSFGVTVLLVPIVVFVVSTTRMAEAARERRLAALRLVGADGKQIRRIASGEALVGAVFGVLLGWAVFLGGAQLVPHITLLEFSTFASDIRPVWEFAVLVTLGVPAAAVITAQAAMRRTIIEPLGIVRRTKPSSRGIVWRLVPMALGVVGLLLVGASSERISQLQIPFLASIVLLLIGVPLVLPWAVERVVRWSSARSVTWQLALRRLQLSSGTAARSVSAIAVVLTGVIALQTVLATSVATFQAQAHDGPTHQVATPSRHEVKVRGTLEHPGKGMAELADALEGLPSTGEVDGTAGVRFAVPEQQRGPRRSRYTGATIVDCATLLERDVVTRCSAGDVFQSPEHSRRTPSGAIRPGERLRATSTYHGSAGLEGTPGEVTTWRAPAELKPFEVSESRQYRYDMSYLLITPQAAENIPWWARNVELGLDFTASASPDAIERVRNVAAEYLEFASVRRISGYSPLPSDDAMVFRLIRYGLLLGTLVAFALIGCGLFVTAAEQIQERRRPMAVLAAVGARRRTLGWSAFLQNGVPMLVAVAVSVVVGLSLGVLVVMVTSLDNLAFDPLGLLGLVGIAAASVLVVTGLTMPALRRAMHPEGLRTE